MAARRLILVGGFLGAGKTTLLAQAADRLEQRGFRVGLITNDQAKGLVDTEILKGQGLEVQEVSGGCFCCRFSCLLSASDLLEAESDKDVVLAEPVGSCTDLSATVLQPLKEYYAHRFSVAPFSVLVDPVRLGQILPAGTDEPPPGKISYLFRTQLEEADLIILNKIDLLSGEETLRLEDALATEFPETPVLELSARTGQGVDAWLGLVLDGAPAASRIARVDYDTYAEAEASLGWLNAVIRLRRTGPADWRDYVSAVLAGFQARLRSEAAEIGHVKLILTAEGGEILANLTSSSEQPQVRGHLTGAAPEASLTVNARVRIAPEALREALTASLARAEPDRVRADIVHIESLSPARPQPTHRFEAVVRAEAPPSSQLRSPTQ